MSEKVKGIKNLADAIFGHREAQRKLSAYDKRMEQIEKENNHGKRAELMAKLQQDVNKGRV